MTKHQLLKIALAVRGETFDSLAEMIGYQKPMIFRWSAGESTPPALARILVDFCNQALALVKEVSPLEKPLTPFDIGYDLPEIKKPVRNSRTKKVNTNGRKINSKG